jgi:8-oxo-dGTP pyrophosphatase MutT (NUDIX family)
MTGFIPRGEEVIHQGPVFSVSVGRIEAPDGEILTREYVRHPGAVIVVPIVDGDVVFVRQYRAAIDQLLLELPAGKRDVVGEEPEVTAARELREEVGLEADTLTRLTSFFNTPGFSDEYSYCYLATGCTEVGRHHDGAEEAFMTVERIPLDVAVEMVTSGEIDDAKTIIGVLLAASAVDTR